VPHEKNVASQVIGAQMITAADGTAFTSAVTAYVTGDAGTQAAGSVGSGACTHEGNGFHTYAPAQAETNYDHIAFTFIGTGAIPATVQVFTTFPQTGDSFARLGAPAGASVSADVAAVKAETASIVADTNELQTDWANGGRLDLILDARASQTSVDTIDDLLDTEVAALTTELAKVPKSDGTATWNATALASIQSEANDALVAYDPPTKAELDAAVANVSVDEIQATALADLFNTDSLTTYASAVAGSVVKEIADNAGGAALTEAGIADAVWDELIAGHAGVGSTGAALSAAGSAGDPWSTALPGAYGAGTAGKIIGDNINATVSSRATQTSVDDLPTNAELATALGTADDAVLAQVALVKAKTDLIPAAPAAVGDIPTAVQNADALLNRDMSAVSDTNSRSPLNALRFIRNKWSNAAGTLTVTKEDDTTSAWTASLSTDPAAEPITGVDPG
jgi:hypothetical protein